ncbi:AP2-associated protein kinase 1-like isoform X2 [Olea europaea var. sylvestris]|uniref:non-specific serine/threonine protein kinase n=1 Tax=Olea europaea subsp. europaea TaxID=158383 RepID=A0A8S0PVH6_OLEEU|nr:AP2-associated protein kinase 1-like isoform X2 [Olea europaea var. sylvestris]CAA2957098.1 probable serine threonine- kinase DDB_G0280111 [Olea europaea subsp. europaea]
MWRFKPFTSKEQTGIEGRVIDIGNFKVQVRNVIAEGGFSSVYSARDAIHGSKQYALKHIICNDEELLELVMKEISVMKSLKGHPNIVTLYAHTIFDLGRTKEALLLMEYCEKSLVNVLENRGAGFFEEKQILVIFRDVCNAVFAMHCQTPPIAHRDLKAENLLLGSDGLWKLCDFGSTSTNHKRFEKPEEMGIEEDNIRKHTTPAYRAPEMWDLFRRELINEKVDIWALGCLLFRISYFKSAFDGESKLQVLNGNYRIPDMPKYNKSIVDLIRDMLQSSPDDRPDITQVWFRVNGLLPEELQKSLPDGPPEIQQQSTDVLGGTAKPSNKSNPMPRRSPPPPPSTEVPQNVSASSSNRNTGGSTGPLGAFWTTQHAKDSVGLEEKTRPKYDEDLTSHTSSGHETRPASHVTPRKTEDLQKNSLGRSVNMPGNGPSQDVKINLFPDDSDYNTERFKQPKPEGKLTFQNERFNAFAGELSTTKSSPGSDSQKSSQEEMLKAEVEMLKEQLSHVNTEKAEITSKYEKLSAICRSQRQEIQELKQGLAARTPPNRDSSRNLATPGSQLSTPTNEKIEGTVLELQQGFFDRRSPSPESQPWQAFIDVSKPQTTSSNDAPKSVRTRNNHQNRQAVEFDSGSNKWGFEADNFKAVPVASSQVNVPVGELKNSKRVGESKNKESKLGSQPSGWAGF